MRLRIGENIKRLREEAGLTQKQLAEKTGIKINRIRKIELCQMALHAGVVQKIALALNCSTDRVLMMDNFLLKEKVKESDLTGIVRALRVKYGLTRKQLADYTGYSQTYCNKLEYNEKPLTAIAIERISKALGISVMKFWEEVTTHAEKEKEEKIAN
ncbi:MAG: helix-turn-helix domain-containing protein [Eubacterium sp.]|jgi:transcriptional regulator with XRE-family HTH domain|nr:helix-turn-helix domain-containing protein [Eubacterium sp.]